MNLLSFFKLPFLNSSSPPPPWSKLKNPTSIGIVSIDCGSPLLHPFLQHLQSTASSSASEIQVEIPSIAINTETLRIGPHKFLARQLGDSRPTGGQILERRLHREYSDATICMVDSRDVEGFPSWLQEVAYVCADKALETAPVLCLLVGHASGSGQATQRCGKELLSVERVEEMFARRLRVITFWGHQDVENNERLEKDGEGWGTIVMAEGRRLRVQPCEGEDWSGVREGLEWLVEAVNERREANGGELPGKEMAQARSSTR